MTDWIIAGLVAIILVAATLGYWNRVTKKWRQARLISRFRELQRMEDRAWAAAQDAYEIGNHEVAHTLCGECATIRKQIDYEIIRLLEIEMDDDYRPRERKLDERV